MPGGRRFVRSAIWKTPVDGRVSVRGVNLEGDEQADRRIHGGPDQAVYAYGAGELRAWEAELDRSVPPGTFGENLTIEGLEVSDARVGDRWAIGTTVLEAVQPRVPCAKLAFRMGDRAFLKRFAQAGRPGAYLRIVQEGELGAGDPVEVVRRADHDVTMRLMFRAYLLEPELAPRLLEAPGLTAEWRAWATERLQG